MLNKAKKILADCRGAVAIEYGLIVALISVTVIAAISSIGLTVQGTFNYIANTIEAVL